MTTSGASLRMVHAVTTTAGGAGRAAVRLHEALTHAGAVESRMLTVAEYEAKRARRAPGFSAPITLRWERALLRSLVPKDGHPRSLSLFPGAAGRSLRREPADLVHLHWVNDGLLSVGQIARLPMPLVWTLHDIWPLAGLEHFAWTENVLCSERLSHQLDRNHRAKLDAACRGLKRRRWSRMQLIAPTRWMASQATKSVVAADWPCAVIPNALPLDTFRPADREEARRRFNLRPDVPVVAFGSHNLHDRRKGGDLLLSAFSELRRRRPDAVLLTFGAGETTEHDESIRRIGWVSSDETLRQLYAAADVTVVPSRADNLPQTATESQACGTPVVGFRIGGLHDAVDSGVTGELVTPCNVGELSEAIESCLAPGRRVALGRAARVRAERLWAPDRVAIAHHKLYQRWLNIGSIDRARRARH
jgi:glycosyltransferase involved in cell wall biosynthesis